MRMFLRTRAVKGASDPVSPSSKSSPKRNPLEALKSLGYSHKDAREALKGVPESVTKTEQRIKEALKKLSH